MSLLQRKSSRLLLVTSFVAVMVSGCATTSPKNTAAAQIAVPDRFVELQALAQSPPSATAQMFGDPVLSALTLRLTESPDVQVAQARLVEAEARLRAARASLFPALTGEGSVTTLGSDGSLGVTSGVVGIGLNAPLDVFGANRSRVGASQARAEEAAYNRARTLQQARATLSQLYVSLRVAQQQIAVTQTNLASANDSLSLAQARQRAGLDTGLAVAQAQSNRDAIAARLPGFQQAQIAARLGMEALLGQLPQSIVPQVGAPAAIPRFERVISATTPSQWLVNRADLSAAARRLQASGLEARAAQRDRLPSLSLVGLASQTEVNRGVSGGAGSLSANLVGVLFDFGRLEALAQAAGAQAEGEAALYRQVVMNALADVESQASRVARGQATIEAQGANVASAQDQAALARARYTSGLSDFLAVLTAERAVFEAQSAQVQAVGETADAEVALSLALGL